MKYILFVVLLSVCIQGCENSSKKSESLSAGVITYTIDYPKEITDSPAGNLMPNKLILSFKDNQMRYSFKGGFSVFSLDFYSLPSMDSCATLFHFMNNDMLFVGAAESNFFFFDKKTKPTFVNCVDEHKVIAGLTCSKAMVVFEGSPASPIYYAKSLDLEIPNRHTPFAEIPGLLMDFYVDYKDVCFHFSASEIDYTVPMDAVFEIPSALSRTSEEEIEGLIIALINNFR